MNSDEMNALANDPFIVLQADKLTTNTSNKVWTEFKQEMASAGIVEVDVREAKIECYYRTACELGRFAAIQTWLRNKKEMQIDDLKNENAELRKRLIPDGIMADGTPGLRAHDPFEKTFRWTAAAMILFVVALYAIVRWKCP